MSAGESARAMAVDLERRASELNAEARLWHAGADGEERVAAALTNAGSATMRVLHDRLLTPGQTHSNLDHLVVCPGGVFLVDAKNWTGATNARDGILWQRWSTAAGPRSANKNREVRQVRGMATVVGTKSNLAVTPVLCLTGDRSAQFGDPVEVDGVFVVPLDRLVIWLRARPTVLAPETVASLAVLLSMAHPPAVEPGLTLASMATSPAPAGVDAPPHRSTTTTPRRGAAHRPSTRRASTRSVAQAVTLVILGLVALTLGPKLITKVSHTVAAAAVRPTTSAPTSTLSPVAQQRLDDWRIRAGLYKSYDQPSELPYMADAGLGNMSQSCRAQESTLARYRSGLLKAPDRELTEYAAKFDKDARAQLSACAHNQPVALHHARDAMQFEADQINVRYNELLGVDPQAYNATHVL